MGDPVEAQLDAYNARDVERFAPCFAEDVVVEDGAGKVLMRGREQLHAAYRDMFAAHPALRCRVVHRIRVGDYVIDEERIAGRGPTELHVVAIYRVEGGLIAAVRLLR